MPPSSARSERNALFALQTPGALGARALRRSNAGFERQRRSRALASRRSRLAKSTARMPFSWALLLSRCPATTRFADRNPRRVSRSRRAPSASARRRVSRETVSRPRGRDGLCPRTTPAALAARRRPLPHDGLCGARPYRVPAGRMCHGLKDRPFRLPPAPPPSLPDSRATLTQVRGRRAPRGFGARREVEVRPIPPARRALRCCTAPCAHRNGRPIVIPGSCRDVTNPERRPESNFARFKRRGPALDPALPPGRTRPGPRRSPTSRPGREPLLVRRGAAH